MKSICHLHFPLTQHTPLDWCNRLHVHSALCIQLSNNQQQIFQFPINNNCVHRSNGGARARWKGHQNVTTDRLLVRLIYLHYLTWSWISILLAESVRTAHSTTKHSQPTKKNGECSVYEYQRKQFKPQNMQFMYTQNAHKQCQLGVPLSCSQPNANHISAPLFLVFVIVLFLLLWYDRTSLSCARLSSSRTTERQQSYNSSNSKTATTTTKTRTTATTTTSNVRNECNLA